MTCYLLHFFPPLKHAKHYIGWTKDEDALRRSLEHKNGTKKGSPLIRAALEAGYIIKLARVWPGANRAFERKLKKRKKASQFCPCCFAIAARKRALHKETLHDDDNTLAEACPVRT